MHAINSQVTVKRGLSDDDKSKVENLKSQIANLKSTTDAGRDALKNIKDAQIEAEIAAAAESKRIYENSVKSAVAAIEARVAASKKGSIEERNAQIEAVRARAAAEKKLNVNITAGERVKIEVEAQKQIQSIHFEYQKKALQDAKIGIDAQILQAQAGSEAEFDLRIQSLEAARQVELKDQELTNNKKQEINARYYRQSVELAKAFNQKVAEDELNLKIANTQSKIAEIEYGNVEKNNVELIELKKKLIDEQAAIEAIGVTYSEKNEELRLAKTKLIYDKALANKQELERQKQIAEIESASKYAVDAIQNDIDVNNERLQLAGRTEEQRRELRLENGKNMIAIGEIEKDAAQAQYDAGLTSFEQYQQKMTEAERKESQGRIAISQAEEDEKRQIRQAAEQIALDLVQVYSNVSKKRYDDELAQAQNLYDQKLITEKEYNARVAQTKRAQAQQDKIKSIFSIAIKTAENIVEAYPNPVLIALAAGLGAAQTAVVASQPLPQYRKGKIGIRWPWY